MNLATYLAAHKESQGAFGSRVGVTQSAVAQWVAGGRVRAEQVIGVSRATDWKVTPHELRPDLYPHPMDGLPKLDGAEQAVEAA